jgi:hypothetical protein
LHGEEAVGVVVQSLLEYPATLTAMEPRAVLANSGCNCGTRSDSSRCQWGRGDGSQLRRAME